MWGVESLLQGVETNPRMFSFLAGGKKKKKKDFSKANCEIWNSLLVTFVTISREGNLQWRTGGTGWAWAESFPPRSGTDGVRGASPAQCSWLCVLACPGWGCPTVLALLVSRSSGTRGPDGFLLQLHGLVYPWRWWPGAEITSGFLCIQMYQWEELLTWRTLPM